MPTETVAVDLVRIVAIGVPLALLLLASFYDLYRRKDLSVVRKALWATFILLTAFIGVAVYYTVRPPRPPEGKRYGHTVPRTSTIVDQLEQLRTEHDAGSIADGDYLTEKRELLGLRA